MSKIKDLEGSISVTDDITPITRQKVESVDSNAWSNMSVSELYDQRIILSNRLVQASASGNYSIVQQIQRGLNQIDAILASHENEIHLI